MNQKLPLPRRRPLKKRGVRLTQSVEFDPCALMSRRKNKTGRVPDVQQRSLLDVAPEESTKKHDVREGVRFDVGDRSRLFVGPVPLKDFLTKSGLSWVLKLAVILDGLDWKAFELSYKAGGRPALHPKVVVGLMMYGLLLKQSSLRQLEALSRRDLGAWWIAGGLTPDHTTFTRFLDRHEPLLAEDFFVQLTATIVKELNLTTAEFAIDGTVIQAVASNASALKREALEKKLEEQRGSASPEHIEKLETAKASLEARAATREAAGKGTDVVVSSTEPEAVLQPQKNSEDFAFAYKPVIGVHSSGLIVGQALSPSNETECVNEVFVQHGQILSVNYFDPAATTISPHSGDLISSSSS